MRCVVPYSSIVVGLACVAHLSLALPRAYQHSQARTALGEWRPAPPPKGHHKPAKVEANVEGVTAAVDSKVNEVHKPKHITGQELSQELKPKASEHKASESNPYRGMNYIPDSDVVICSCAKCGSTSLLQFVYQSVFGHNWTYQGAPYLQEVWSDRWEETFDVITDIAKQRKVMRNPKTFSFALIREPKDRVLSAWSSKVACDKRWKLTADLEDRAVLVPHLLALEGKGRKADCLELHDFLLILNNIRRANKSHLLNDHFRPQTHDCFKAFSPDQWSQVVEIGAPRSFNRLAKALGDGISAEPPHAHTSSHGFYEMSSEDRHLLEEITEEERSMIDPYLHKTHT